MSRVYFHSPSGEAELWGGERAWMGGLCQDLAIGIMDVRWNAAKFAVLTGRPVPEGSVFTWADSIGLHMRVGEGALAWKGQPLEAFALILNTALRAGSRPVQLAARVHGQCELHAWCAGYNRAWLASIIDEGLVSGVFRTATGWREDESWEAVARFLRERDDEPVVLSYSVCVQFPNRDLIGMGWEEDDDNAWDALPDQERWDRAFAALTAMSGGRELRPAGWETFAFGHKLSAFDLLASDWEQRLDAALGTGQGVNDGHEDSADAEGDT